VIYTKQVFSLTTGIGADPRGAERNDPPIDVCTPKI